MGVSTNLKWSNFMNKKIIGIFIPKHHYQSMKNGDSLFPSYAQFEYAAENYQRSVCFLTTECHYSSNKTNVLMRENASDRFVEMTINIPKVIYNRGNLNNKKVRQTLHQLMQSGSKVFNYIPIKNSKYYVNKLLEQEAHLIEHLPATLKGSAKNLEFALHHMESFFIKPCYSSIGKGIMHVEKERNGNLYIYERHGTKKSWKKRRYTSLENKLLKKLFKQRSYIIQERIPLATFQDRPFDLRVIVQKDGTGHWKISGMVAKLAPIGQYITNIGRGGEMGELQNYFIHHEISISEITKKINTLAIDIAITLEKTWPYISDLGFDIGITNKGTPFFIECNLRGQYGVLRKNDKFLTLWKKIHEAPISYANYLLEIQN